MENPEMGVTFAAISQGVPRYVAEIIPKEPGQVMLPRDSANCASMYS